jgi:ATP-dependent helicase/nuclease subunit B
VIPRVFTIPTSLAFLPTLIRALGDGTLVPEFPGPDPLALSAATVYLPTRRACRAAGELFLDTLGRDAAVLPRFVALGDVDEDDFAFSEASGAASLDLPPAMPALERRLLLARLIAQWARSPEVRGARGAPLVAANPAAALTLADELARLIDDMTTRQVPWHRLDELVPERFDAYWQLSLRFLQIARDAWPAILRERGRIDEAERRDRLLIAEAMRLAEARSGSVIAAGSTGSMPATATLLAAIAALPNGALVLPGLDTDLDRKSWECIGGRDQAPAHEAAAPAAGHPQFAMHMLLRRIGMDREMVVSLGEPGEPRARLVSEAFRPAPTTELWTHRLDDRLIGEALAGVAVIEAANAEEEANAIAVALREAIEPKGTQVALVTADRALARRVAAALGRWNVAYEDSRGNSLAETLAGVFARLAAEAALAGLPPVTLLALLKHRLFRLGKGPDGHARALAALERALLRGPAPRPGSAGLAHALAAFRRARGDLHPRDSRAGLTDPELDAAAGLIDRLAGAIEPLERIAAAPQRFGEIAARHRQVVAALGADAAGTVPAFAGEDGFALADAFEEIAARRPADDLVVAPRDYPDLFRTAIADRYVRNVPGSGARVHILGPLEARLQSFDAVVVGGLVEGSWPPETHSDPWLSRPMRQALGLDLPERRIGLSAHDFAQCLGAARVILARAGKLAGAPTVASRFVQRLAAVAGASRWSEALARGRRYLALARALDRADRVAIETPAPRPPRAARPTYLTVTDVEHWLRDPYTIYAKHVLRLAPLDAVNTPPGARDRGNLIHNAIGDFTQRFAEALPPDALAELLRLGAERFAPLEDFPAARAFWWPRFLRIAAWLVGWDAARRAGLANSRAEIRGEIAIALGDRSFRLAARADRIDRSFDGQYVIVDYKTGEVRTEKQVRAGLAPQLTLEAAILRNGGFPEIPRGASVAALLYVQLKGGEPAGEEIRIDFKEGTPDSQADRALARFTELVARFDREDQPFRSLVHPMWKARYGDYDHLARVKEWSLTAAADPNGS